jgi:phosphotransferase family enzyme
MDCAVLAEIGRSMGGSGEPAVLYDRHGVLVVRVGDLVVKAHQADRDNGPRLARRLAVAAALPGLLLAPLGPPRQVGGRVVTVWPYGEPVNPDCPPWEEGGRLLARLHNARRPGPADDLPRWGRPTRVARVVAGLDDGWPEAREIRRAFATLPEWIRAEAAVPAPPPVLIHGDWHLGQLVGLRGAGWRMIDVEDLGLGDPAWDLARPAALLSAGVLPADDWIAFLHGYQTVGGPAVPPGADLWETLETPARTLAIQIAATCVISARTQNRSLDPLETALVDTCGRIAHGGVPG